MSRVTHPHDRRVWADGIAVTRTAAPPRRRLGEILVELGIVTDDQISQALELPRAGNERLGDVLLREGLVQPRDLLRALASQYDLEFVDLDDHPLDADLTQAVPVHLSRRHRAIPVWRADGRIVVAMANPADVLALDDIRSALGERVRPVMADGRQISAVIDRLGHSDTRVQEAIEAAVDNAAANAVVESQPTETIEVEEKAPIVKFVELLLSKAVQERASDIHIEPTADSLRIRFRVDGVLHEAMAPPRSLQNGIISRIKVMADIDIAERRLPQDGRVTTVVGEQSVDLRVVTLPTVHGEAAVLRILRNDDIGAGLENLGFLPGQLDRFRSAIDRPWGAILVTGPTGSGKSTTLYGAIEELKDTTRNIVTVEDPVERRMSGVKQVQVNTKAGLSFANALRAFLRADPDVMLVGEIRDGETATIAVEASLTGHLVLSTLHTNNSASTPMRLIEMGVEPFLVTSAVSAVVAQRLARRLCDRCRIGREMTLDKGVDAGIPEHFFDDGPLELFHPAGCEACGHTGYRGRFAIHEVMVMTDELAELILHRATAEDVERLAIEQGLSTLRHDGLTKVADGLTSLEELLRVTG